MGTVFKSNTSIVKIDFTPFTGVKSMTGDPFQGCTNLEFVNMPPNLTSTGEVFQGISKLKKVTFHEGYKTASYCLFEYVGGNLVLDLPSTLTSMNAQTFRASPIPKVTFVMRGNVGTFDPLKNTNLVTKIYVPDAYLSNYQTYLSGNGNLSKLAPLSQYTEKPWDEV